MESASVAADPPGAEVGGKGLKTGALGFLSNLVIGVASTAPAYSLAATLGFVVAIAGVGLHAPAVLLVSFIPMLLIAAAYSYMNKADPDCGTSFTWVTKAMGPRLGWLTGWAIVVGRRRRHGDARLHRRRLHVPAVRARRRRQQPARRLDRRRLWIAVMTWICYIGIELSARTQYVLLGDRDLHPRAVRGRRADQGVRATAGIGSVDVAARLVQPVRDPGLGALINGVLLGVFIYWGWDSGVCVNEESRRTPRTGPGKAAVVEHDPAGPDLPPRGDRRAGLRRAGTSSPTTPTTSSRRSGAMFSGRRSTSC